MIVCGWCAKATKPGTCSNCGRDAALPWLQRAQEPPRVAEAAEGGRPALDASQIRQKLRIAIKELGGQPTNAQLAEQMDVAESTVRRWRKLAAL